MDVVKQYLDYLYSVLDKDEISRWMFTPPGVIVLRSDVDGDLFEHPHIKIWHRFLVEYYRPERKEFALILPCTARKPYRISAVHRIVDSRIERYGLAEHVAIYVMSEPMILVPRELDIYYPFANYDFPPNHLSSQQRRKFVLLLSKVLEKIRYVYDKIFAVLPKHHMGILMEAVSTVGDVKKVVVINYGRKAFRTVATVVDTILSELRKT